MSAAEEKGKICWVRGEHVPLFMHIRHPHPLAAEGAVATTPSVDDAVRAPLRQRACWFAVSKVKIWETWA